MLREEALEDVRYSRIPAVAGSARGSCCAGCRALMPPSRRRRATDSKTLRWALEPVDWCGLIWA